MNIRNIHERILDAPLESVGALIDSLASEDDRLWPKDLWPAMRMNRPLAVGAQGGHGPIRYTVEAYAAAESVRFRFTAPRGFQGTHGLDLEVLPTGGVRLRHSLVMQAQGRARVTWPLLFRPLHDALIEDAFDRAERSLGLPSRERRWPVKVRVLRWILKRTSRRRSGES
ncbi:MAG TPA: SRPBCC family protein [Thermoanaerobaculia bacterium]|nr:SRPBCC family protein [Thermoanaerobaculia bacterium]